MIYKNWKSVTPLRSNLHFIISLLTSNILFGTPKKPSTQPFWIFSLQGSWDLTLQHMKYPTEKVGMSLVTGSSKGKLLLTSKNILEIAQHCTLPTPVKFSGSVFYLLPSLSACIICHSSFPNSTRKNTACWYKHNGLL